MPKCYYRINKKETTYYACMYFYCTILAKFLIAKINRIKEQIIEIF